LLQDIDFNEVNTGWLERLELWHEGLVFCTFWVLCALHFVAYAFGRAPAPAVATPAVAVLVERILR
jgi:hypothetical protein